MLIIFFIPKEKILDIYSATTRLFIEGYKERKGRREMLAKLVWEVS